MAASITGTLTLIDRASGPMRRMERQALRTQAAIEGVGGRLDKMNRSTRSVTKSLTALDVELQRKNRDLRLFERRLDSATSRMNAAAKSSDQLTRAQRNNTRAQNEHTSSTRQGERSTTSFTQALRRLGGAFSGLRAIISVIKFPALIAAFGTLVQVAGALGAAVIALVPRIADLAGALAVVPAAIGAAVQGLVTLKIATMGVGDALKAGIQLQQNAARSARDYADQQRAAARQVKSAEESVMLAQRAGRDAQRQLTEARRAARRELVDMRLAAEGGALAEKRAALNLREARDSLSRARSSGTGGTELQSLTLSVSEARLALKQSRIDARRMKADNRRAQRAGVEGSDGVRGARRSVSDAVRAQTQATEQLADAQLQANRLMQDGTSDAQKYREAMENLSPEAQTFVKQLLSMRGTVKDLRREAGRDLFPGLTTALGRLTRGVPMLRGLLRSTGRVIGRNAAAGADQLTSEHRLRDLGGLGRDQTRIINQAGQGTRNLMLALVDFMVAARPFNRWVGDTLLGWTRWIRLAARSGRETGAIGVGLQRTQGALKQFGRILRDSYKAMRALGRAARPLGDDLWDSMERGARGWRQWSESAEGQQKMADFFDRMRPVIKELGGLLWDVVKALGRLASDPANVNILKQLREAVPDMERGIRAIRDALTGPMITALVQFVRLLSNLSEVTGPLKLIMEAFGRILRIVNLLLETVPGLSTALSAALSIILINRFIGRVRVLKGLWESISGYVGRSKPGAGPGGAGGGGTTVVGGGKGGGTTGAGGGKGGGKGGRFRGALGKGGGAAGIAAAIGGTLLGDAIGGNTGNAISGLATGAATGAMIGSVIPGLGTGAGAVIGGLIGGGASLLGGIGQGRENARAQGAASADRFSTGDRAVGRTRSRIAFLQSQMGTPGGWYNTGPYTEAGRQMPGGRIYRPATGLTGNARRRAETELKSLRGKLPGLEKNAAVDIGQTGRDMFDVYQTGNAAQRRAGRGAITRMFTEEFRKMGPDGKRELGKSVGAWIGELRKGNASQRRLARTLTREVRSAWGDMGKNIQIVNGQILTGSASEWKQIQRALEDPVEKARQAVSKGFTDMQKQAVGSLQAMGYSKSEARSLIRAQERGGATEAAKVGSGISAMHGDRHATGDGWGRRSSGGGRKARTGDGPGLMGASSNLAPYARSASGFGLSVSSGLRPGAITNAGNQSYHSTGNALDLAGPPDAMMAFAKAMVAQHGSSLEELIYSPLGFSIKNGKRVPAYAVADHYDHVHIADTGKGSAVKGGKGGGGATIRPRLHKGGGAAGAMANAALQAMAAGLNSKLGGTAGGAFSPEGPMPATAAKGAMSFNAVAKIAESVGLPGVTFAQIARGESSLIPTAIGNDPGGTQGLGLWQITTGFNDDIIKRFGGRNAMFDPYTNALAAKAIYDRQGVGAWYGTKFMTGTDLHYKGDGPGPSGDGMGFSGGSQATSGPQVGPRGATVQHARTGKGINVTVHIENYNVEGQIKDALEREFAAFADDLALIGSDE